MAGPYLAFNGPIPAQSTGATVLTAAELSASDWVVIISDTPTLTITSLLQLAQFIQAGGMTGLAAGASGLVATGTTQATAFPIGAVINVFATVAVNAGCYLPEGYSSSIPIQVVNNGAHNQKVYPFEGDQIAGYGVNEPVLVGIGAVAAFACFDPVTQVQPRTWWPTA